MVTCHRRSYRNKVGILYIFFRVNETFRVHKISFYVRVTITLLALYAYHRYVYVHIFIALGEYLGEVVHPFARKWAIQCPGNYRDEQLRWPRHDAKYNLDSCMFYPRIQIYQKIRVS